MLFIRSLYKLSLSFIVSGSLTWHVQSAPLQLADEPLFLGGADPNVFFELDDSGSMDFAILTVSHYEACQYDKDAPDAEGDDDCRSQPKQNGLWNTYGTAWKWSNYQSRWVIDYQGYFEYHYMFHNSDNKYWGCRGRGIVETCGGFENVYKYDWRGGSSDFNVLFYNPKADYGPWAGTGLGNTSFSAARSNPQPAVAAVTAQAQTTTQYAVPAQDARAATSGYSYTKNLTGFIYHVWDDSHGFTGDYPRRGNNLNRSEGENGKVDLWDNFYRYTVDAASVTREKVVWDVETSGDDKGKLTAEVTETITFTGAEPNPPLGQPSRTVAEIQQNVANWYSYARRRAFVAKGAIGAVVASNTSFRFGLTVLNNDEDLFHEMPSADIKNYQGYNTQMLNDLYSFPQPDAGTPLRLGLKNAGEYFKGNVSDGNGGRRPSPIIESCQQNFTVLFTDGYWNKADPGIGNEDGDPFGGGGSGTVSDVAYYYYKHDLDNDATNNNVIPNDTDPATYQHMVTFPVAFGLTGTLEDTDSDGWPNPVLSISSTWGGDPSGTADKPEKIDDLWHAAYNSKGEFVSAKTPEDVVDSLVDALSEISSRDSSSASVATSTGQISSDTAIFQAQFNSGDWSGQLYSYSLNADRTVNQTTPNWQASDVLDAQNPNTGRTIISYNGSRGIPFRFPANYRSPVAATEMGSAMISELLSSAPFLINTTDSIEISENQAYGTALVNYLRGDRTNEGVSSTDFRARGSVLGDIISSDPKYVSAPRLTYSDDIESVSYAAFRSANQNRIPMVYVGANDGMLHGFDATTGRERLAYVPKSVYKNLYQLSETPYNHRYFVDAAPTIVDAFYDSAWHTVLVGALGGGGQGLFALDVTNPSQFSEASANNTVLWEFTDANDADLGYSFSEASIAKMANGDWVAVFGNGYNNTEVDGYASATGRAVLFIVNIKTGALVKKIDTGVGDTATPNGLATPALIDINGDSVVDYIYAGDLRGNMWKFNVQSPMVADWDVAWTSGSTKHPLFNAGQPITTQPSVGHHQSVRGQLVYFGTGKYLEYSDRSVNSQPTQSFYAIWDKNETDLTSAAVVRNDLLQQEIQDEFSTTIGGYSYNIRTTTRNAIDWSDHDGWYIDLVNYNDIPVFNSGERQVTESLLRNGRIIFTTLIPNGDACSPGGSSWLMELEAYSGAGLPDIDTPFDLDRNNVFDDVDHSYNVPGVNDIPPSGVESSNGIVTTPGVLRDGTQERKYLSGSSGSIDDLVESTGVQFFGRQSWRELD
ncbi:type IV pilus assembly protein PilY1 [Alteromonadaceae bacterium 2753L.S.0a.02]|nr:type IV pilus assembly protein PilY1 [Alteromonadaceae bacterium 2753L.S.0a.02]